MDPKTTANTTPKAAAGAYSVLAACLALLLSAVPEARAAAPKSHLTHYGVWKDSDIPLFQRFGLVALQPGMYGPPAVESQAIARVRAKGTLVLMYVSLGEDPSTYGQAKPAVGDGRGPVHWDPASGTVVFGNKGMASYYLDEWNAKGWDPNEVNKVPDGLPDRQGDWGSCLVNAGDTAWQRLVLEQVARVLALGADGIFMDTPETASPWHGYGWTAPGMHDLIKRIREANPGKYLLLNRGLFFFDPDYPAQYQASPRKYLNAVLFESYFTGSNYTVEQGGNGSWRESPYFPSNKYINAPRLNAEFGRPDSYGDIFHIDYIANPMRVAQDEPDFFQRIMDEVVLQQGWVPQITDRLLALSPTAFLDSPPPPDEKPPHWQNTAASGVDMNAPPAPRVGLLKAIPGDGKVTLRWDVAADQTRPVRYNVYYSKDPAIDYHAPAGRLAAVKTEVGADYTDRARVGTDDGCPYEFTVTGLANNVLYRFAVRAEDGTAGVAAPASGRIGPGGGMEETNTVVLMAAPRGGAAFPIAIDGAFDDWNALAAYPDPAGDGSGVDFLGARASDDAENLYLALESSGAADPARIAILFNSDRRSHTGDATLLGAGFRGADYKWEAGALYRHQNSAWTRTAATVLSRNAGNRLELRIAKRDLGAAALPGVNLLAVSTDRRETLPDQGLTGLSYTFTSGMPISVGAPPGGLPGPGVQSIRITGAPGSGTRIAFRNPNGRAEIRILDMRGRLLWQGEAAGEDIAWPSSAGSASLFVIRVAARGLPAASRLLIPR